MFKEINLNTFPKLHILIDLSYLKGTEKTLSEYEKEIERVKGDPETREVFEVLKEKNILLPTTKKYSYQFYKLNIKLLCKLIERQIFIQKIYRYFDYIH